MFGFTRLASYDYFAHVERALHARFDRAGQPMETHVSDVLPTASVRRRAAKLAELIARTATSDGPVHLVGHSTGGLDARLVASPCAHLSVAADAMRWLPRLRSVTTMNTPHLGSSPDLHANDGCVPIRSQLWGDVVWAGLADHLDVLGHYRDDTPEVRIELRHHDWLTSGSRFDDTHFEALMDAITNGMLRSTA